MHFGLSTSSRVRPVAHAHLRAASTLVPMPGGRIGLRRSGPAPRAAIFGAKRRREESGTPECVRRGIAPILLAVLLSPAVRGATPRTVYRIETVAGSAHIGDGGPATAAQLSSIQGVAADRWGNVYVADTDHQRVRKISTSGVMTTVAGTGTAGFSGDGGPGSAAQLNLPYGLAVDLAGYVYVADLGNNRVRRISPDGTIVTIAGNGHKGTSPDGGAATDAALMTPRNVAIDAAGNLYVSEFEGHRVRKVSPDGRIWTAAGIGVVGYSGEGGPATQAQLAFPAGLAVDRAGALYIADSQNNRIRKILAAGNIVTALGGSPSTLLAAPLAVSVDVTGTIYAADSSNVVRAYTTAGKWSDVAGTAVPGFSGDGGPANKAQTTAVHDVAAGLNGYLYIADGVRVRAVDPNGRISTLAGDGYLHAVGDGGAATDALLFQPSAVAGTGSGVLYIADSGTQRIRQVSASGTIATLGGSLNSPMGVAADFAGNVWIADTNNQLVREVAANGNSLTIAGTGTAGIGPEGLAALQTALRSPRGVCLDHAGILYIVDTANHRVLQVQSNGSIATAAGNGAPGDAGDGGPARLAQLNQPSACALDAAGNLYIADTFSHRIRKVAGGTITTVAGTGSAGLAGDEGPATAAMLSAPRGVAVDESGNVFIADSDNHRIRQIAPDGVIHTIAGQTGAGFAGDGDLASNAQLNSPGGLFLDNAGALYVADTNNNRIRRLVAESVVPPGPIATGPALTAVNAASQRQGPVAPGEIVSVFGVGIGPETGAAGSFDAAGLLGNLLAGAEVRFDGVPAPLLYAQAAQINAQVPYTVAGAAVTHMEVWYQGRSAGALDLPVAAAAPGIFAVAINQDGGTNAASAPAARGSILTLFATGEGVTDGANVSGQAAGTPYPRPVLPVILAIAGVNAELLYAGAVPGGVGVLQINARVPAGFVPPGPATVELSVGSFPAPPATVWLK